MGALIILKVTQSSTSSSFLNQLTFPSYDGGCLAVIDKLSVSSVKPWDRPTFEYSSMKPSPSDDILFGSLIPEGNRYLVVVEDLYVVALDLFRRVPSVNTDGLILPCCGLS